MSKIGRALRRPQNWSLLVLRLAAAAAALAVASIPLLPRLPDGQGHAMRWAVGLLGAFILLDLALELLALALWGEENQRADEKEGARPFRETAGVLVSTPGVILGLLAVFGNQRLHAVPVKVAAVSLAFAVLLAIVYYSLNAWPGATEGVFATVPRFVYHVTLWALTLGLLSVAMSIVLVP
jgi:hypothetical protein